MSNLLWILMAFGCGALPFSLWVGQLALRKDIRAYGDGNPGATNVFRAGGRLLGFTAFLLDTLKGTVPVGYAYFFAGVTGPLMVAVALAPILGHAFSPFLRFRGGKAVAVTFGVWVGLTIWEIPTFSGLLLLYWFKVIKVSGWAVMCACASILLYLLLTRFDPLLLAVWAGSTAILAYTHRADLRQAPTLREDAWVRKVLAR
ncbi:MAG: glycerol-3-phosphate acyltransferase [Chloroflexi bacterium]|nr:glycerol-3-phosphate acyltransferase [Chloroflexota bacterium]